MALPLLHVDSAQAFPLFDCRMDELGVDLMTISAHKMYGPKGIGALCIRSTKSEAPNPKQIQNTKITKVNKHVSDFGFRISDLPLVSPMVTGGGQEFGLRSGTENVPLIAGFGEAVSIAEKYRQKERERLRGLLQRAWSVIRKVYPSAQINGPDIKSPHRTPHILNVHLRGVSTEELLTYLDMSGITASSGSACRSRSLEASHVVQALGYSVDRAKQSLRFSFGRQTTMKDLARLAVVMKKYRMSPRTRRGVRMKQ